MERQEKVLGRSRKGWGGRSLILDTINLFIYIIAFRVELLLKKLFQYS